MNKSCKTCRWLGEWKSRFTCESEKSGRAFVFLNCTCPEWAPKMEDCAISPDRRGSARLLTAEEACSSWGHGYEEIWFHADEEMQECKLLFEIVFINGEFVCADGDHGTIDPDTYNTPYNSRVWLGDAPPTDEQREKTPWKETST